MTRLRPWRGASLVVMTGLLALGAGGCATGGVVTPRAANQQAGEIERLKDRVLELQRRLSVTEVELERLRREVARLGGSPIDETPIRRQSVEDRTPERPAQTSRTPTSPGNRADRGFEVEDIEAEPTPPVTPPAAVEETAREPEPVRVRPPASDREETAAAPASPEVEPVTREAQDLYDRGYTLYHQGRFVDAESAFQRFLQGHARTELADNAQYWIGEARLARGDVQGALRAFQETARRFPDGNKVPDALLKAGEAQVSLGDVAEARRTYEEVARRFAGTTAAAVAAERLAALR